MMQAGDRNAVAALYDRYGSAAYGLAYRISNDATMAEDAVQDAFVAVWQQIRRFDPERGQVRPWLLAIVRHKAIDAVRRRAGRPERLLPDGPDRLVASHGDPAELAERGIDAEAVRDAIRRIPEEQRRTIEMAYFQGLTHSEIARAMDVPPGTVKSRLRIGLEKLRDYLRLKVME
jgi:RNA polymerase sigma-70 factor (ECF subfamily)